MKTKEIDELVERYIRGDLSKEEKEFLAEKIKSDASFREAYDLHRHIKKALEDEDMNEFEQLLKDVYQEKTASHPFFHKSRMVYAVAAAFVVLVGLGVVLLFQVNRKTQNERLFEQYYSSYTFDNYRSGQQSHLTRGYAFYMEQAYDSAVIYAKQVLEEQEDPQAAFLAGISLLADGKYKESIPFFTRVMQSENVSLKENAAWYKALALLRLNKNEEAVLLLNRIKDAGNDYADQAAELLLKLRP